MPDVIEATFVSDGLTVEAAEDGERRILAGLAVPWNVVGRTSAGPVKFLPGSLDAAARPPLDREHDTNRLIGVVTAAAADDIGLHAKARVSRVHEGDDVLALADDGALSGFSVTAEPIEFSYEQDDEHGTVMVVAAADWQGLAVVRRPAFTAARITQVAASAPDPNSNTNQEEATVPTAAPSDAPVVEAAEAVPAVIPLAGVQAPAPAPFINAGDFAAHLVWADQRHANLPGHADARARIEAAAPTDHSTASGLTGLLPPNYSSEILGGLPVSTPFVDNLVRRTGLPATGMSIIKPQWGDLPDSDGWYTSENTNPSTDAVTLGTKSVSVLTWAKAARASINLIERSAFGGFAQNYFEQVGITYRSQKESKVIEAVLAAVTTAGNTYSAEDSVAATIGALVEACITQQVDSEGNFRGLMPEFAAVGKSAWTELTSTKVMDGPAFSSGSFQFGRLQGSLSGLGVFLIPGLGDDDVLVGARAATVVQDGSEMQLRTTVVNTMSVELGVIANMALDVEYVDALAYVATGS